KFDDYVSKGGHDYRPDLRLAIFKFFNQHLKNENPKIMDADFPKIEGKDLRVFPEDKDLPKDAINSKVDETFVPTAKITLPAEPKGFAGWKLETIKQLREKCFRALPEKVPEAKIDSIPELKTLGSVTEPGIVIDPAILSVRPKRKAQDGLTWIILNTDEDHHDAFAAWKKRYPDSDFLGGFTRGGGPYRWPRKNPPNTVERSLALVGQTADSGRVRDVAAMLSKDRVSYTKQRLVARGQASIIAAYAALFVPGAVDEVVIADPPLSHRDGPHFLNVLRVLDIPEALGLLAPGVKLTLVGKNAKDKAFDRTAAIYKAAGVAEKFKRE
ncbi:MAG TPA: hypothetical protein VLM40_04615, partial [Gemmata sp.]|nr:hypothetical protein [Gemmata sp.]